MIRVSEEDKMRLRNKAPDLVINSETINRINKTTHIIMKRSISMSPLSQSSRPIGTVTSLSQMEMPSWPSVVE